MKATPDDIGSIRIRVGRDPEKLRDYFLRLGADATIDLTGAVDVRLAHDDDVTLEHYLSSWSSINKIPAQIARDSTSLRRPS